MVYPACMLVRIFDMCARGACSDALTVESGGAALPHQANVFPDKEHFGRIFYNMVRRACRITVLNTDPTGT